MVHSPALETMVHLEHMYAQTVRQRTEEKDKLVRSLADQQTDEMNKAVDRLEDDMTETKINELVARHYEDHSLLIVKLTSEIDTIKEAQRREYREWLMQMLEQNQATNSLPTPKYAITKNLFISRVFCTLISHLLLVFCQFSNKSFINLHTWYII